MVSGTLHNAHQPDSFAFTKANLEKVDQIILKYPEGKQQSAVMPLLDLAQRQIAEKGPYGPYPTGGGWVTRAAMDEIARILDMPPVKVYEVATFYTMYNLNPMGKYHVQICGTTPCMLCGAKDITKACKSTLGIEYGETTDDGMFTLSEVECMGACCNAPMVQINDDYYEDLTVEAIVNILEDLKAGKSVKPGPQQGRKGSEPIKNAV